MTAARARQRGQAMIETLLLLPMLILAFLAVTWMGNLQFAAQAMLQASRQAALSAAAGAPVEAALRGSREVSIGSLTDARHAGLSVELSAEWLDASARLMSATVLDHVAGVGPWGAVRIERHISVAAGAGNARGDEDAQRRIGAARMAWGQAAGYSQSLARDLGKSIRTGDAPWRRSELSLDWLSPWADLAPADSVVDGAGAGQ